MSWVRNLYRDFGGGFTVDIEQWEILDQGVTALWGQSGAGKSSVFRLLLGLEQAREGFTWKLGDLDLAALPTPQRRLGVVFQSMELFPHMTARENILFAAEARAISKPDAEKHLQDLRESLGLDAFFERKGSVISGGERQRVALARALMGRPRILFLDEPFSALDSGMRAEARKLVKATIDREKIPTVLVTHDREDLEAFPGKITELKAGRIVSGA